jgi:hypothetical protein
MLFEMATNTRREPIRTLGGVVREALRTAFQTILLLLMIAGIAGVAFKSLSPDGWLMEILESAWDRGPVYLLFATMGIIASIAWLRSFLYRRPGVNNRTGDLMAAGFIGAGIYFCVYILNGGML